MTLIHFKAHMGKEREIMASITVSEVTFEFSGVSFSNEKGERIWVRFLDGDRRTPAVRISKKCPRGFHPMGIWYASQRIRYIKRLIREELEA